MSTRGAERFAIQAGRSWVIESFETVIRVNEDGSTRVQETIRPRFSGSFSGIYRDIPIRYRTPHGFAFKLELSVDAVTDAQGSPLRHEESREGDYRRVKVWIPDAADATRTVVIAYRVSNAIRFFDADDERDGIVEAYEELYWNATGTEWPVPIESATAIVMLPDEATEVRAHAYTGAFGSEERDATVAVDANIVRFHVPRELSIHEGLTVGVAWAAGVVDRPTTLDRVAAFLFANWPLIVPFFVFLFMYRTWSARGRDPELGSIAAQYDPPAGMTPAEVGVVADNSADMRDITATIVDLAVRGFLRIEEIEKKGFLGFGDETVHRFRLERSPEDWGDIRPHERALLDGLFEGRANAGDVVSTEDLEHRFYRDLPGIESHLMDSLVRHGIYDRRPDHVVASWLGVGLAVAIGVTIGGILLAEPLGLAFPAVVIAGVATAAIVIVFGLLMPARTIHGARTLAHVRGLEEFLDRVESDRFRRMITGPEMFEKLLPYAMALGVEKSWAAAFKDIYTEPPNWYVGTHPHGFRPGVFVYDLGHMSTRTASAMASAPRSSGGSSFSGGGGGGFSGGGFGGGGGGAF